MKKKIFTKVLSINILLTIIPITLIIFFFEVYARSKSNWNNSYFHPLISQEEMIENAKKKIKASKNLKLSIGDSFGQHGWKTDDGNLLDNIFKCDNKENCIYLNLSNVGAHPGNYFNSIKQVLGDRIYSPNKNEKILIKVSIFEFFRPEYLNI